MMRCAIPVSRSGVRLPLLELNDLVVGFKLAGSMAKPFFIAVVQSHPPET